MRRIVLLGASGSIGTQTLEILNEHRKSFQLIGFSVGERIETVEDILKTNKYVKFVVVKNDLGCLKLQNKYPEVIFFSGDEGLIKMIEAIEADLIVNALVGFVGFLPTVVSLKRGINVALANKESLVVGGEIINSILKNSKAKLYPIDSEHVALFKCMTNIKSIKRLVLTASGGSFRNLNREQLKNVTVSDALKHPSWVMGPKITIDSATMMNKGFEIIEAHYLFNCSIDKISVLLHDESHIHSLVEYNDGSYLADIGPADMKIPISYALFKKKRVKVETLQLPIEKFGTFHFHEFKLERYPCVQFALQAIKIGGTMPTVLNAANEVAVQAFLAGNISFLDIETAIEQAMKRHRVMERPNVDDIIYVDKLTREETHRIIKEIKP